MDLCKKTEDLWKVYFSTDAGAYREILDWLEPDCVIIGTGAHEFYEGRQRFAQALKEEMAERANIPFQFKDLWSRQKGIGPGACMVYGGLHIWWQSEDKRVLVDMESRFTILYRQTAGRWRVACLHMSMPNREQAPGEYYPKTLAERVRDAEVIADELEEMAMRDGLTGLFNYRAMQEYWRQWSQSGGWLFAADLDDFKSVNDTYGHLAGNRALQRVASIAQASVRTGDIVCRVGGDEFVLLCGGLRGKGDACKLAERLFQNLEVANQEGLPRIRLSMGGTAIRPGEALEEALERADRALYAVKKSTKNSYRLN